MTLQNTPTPDAGIHDARIAIVGLSCLFPGAATPEAYWQNLIAGLNTTSEATAEQFGVDPAVYYDPTRRTHDTTYSLRGGYVHDAPPTPPGMDRSAAWSLYVAREALADSGHLDRAESLARCGLILGGLSFPTQESHAQIAPIYDAALGAAIGDLLGTPDLRLERGAQPERRVPDGGGADSVHPLQSAASAVAEALGLGGAHFAIDAACASSVYAVGLACAYLRAGRTDLMLAGAVSAADPLFVNMGFTHFGAYPDGGESRPLDADSGGLISGEGAGALVLKRYADAVRDGDRVYAVIGGIGLSNDGRGKHPLTPNSSGQITALQRAYAGADYAVGGIDPRAVQYIECHASGTPLGDKTELNSMDAFFSDVFVGDADAAPLIGSVKANHGHLLTVAGLASMLKVILSMQHGQIPATIHVQHPLTAGRFGAAQVVSANTPWPDEAKTAGVNAFGFGGVSAHIVLQNPAAAGAPRSAPHQADKPGNAPLAIVGMDIHVGGCDGLDAFAQTLYDGAQHFTPLPPKRWKGLAEDAPPGAYIEQFEIDFLRFKFPPRADDQPTPQHLLLLKVADGAVRDAGLAEGANVAVIVALGTELSLHQYRGRLDLSWQIEDSLSRAGIALEGGADALTDLARDAISPPAQVNQYTSFIGNIVSTRVSALWNFSGPSFTLTAAENSVFRALEVAQLLLADSAPGLGALDAVVIGAVDLAGGVESVVTRRAAHPVNTGAATLSFDQGANGWQVGEGAGAIVLQRPERAISKKVYARVEGVAIVPDVDAESVAQAAAGALAAAGIAASAVGYVEASASGIAAQDEAEIVGLNRVYGTTAGDVPATALGSAKANIGHTGAASGVVSLIKAALCLHLDFLPATPNWSAPKLPAAWGHNFYIPQESRTWFTPVNAQRIASVSGVSDDTSAHVVLRPGAPLSARTGDVRASEPGSTYLRRKALTLIPLDGDNQAELMQHLDALERALNGKTPIPQIARQRFDAFGSGDYAATLVGRDRAGLLREIGLARTGIPDAFARGGDWATPAGSAFSARPLGIEGSVAFVYPGGFNSYPGAGAEWLHLFPAALGYLESMTADSGGKMIETLLYPRTLAAPTRAEIKAARARLSEAQNAIMQSGTVLAMLYTQIIRGVFNIRPDAAFGYSMGEGSMFWAMDVWQDSDEASDVFNGSDLFKTRLFGRKQAIREAWGLPDDADGQFWASFVLSASAAQIAEAVDAETRVYVTHINTPNELVIAGDPAACQRVIDAVGCTSIRAPFDNVIHNQAMLSEYDEFCRIHHWPADGRDQGVTFYSAAEYAPTAVDSDLIARNIGRASCKQVDFPRLIRRAYRDGARIFIELGPGSTCTRWIQDTLRAEGSEYLAVAVDNLRLDDHTALIRMLARLVSHRVPLKLESLYEQAAPTEAGKQLLRTVMLGGDPVREVILSADHRARFSRAARRVQPQAAPVRATAAVRQPVAAIAQAAGASAVTATFLAGSPPGSPPGSHPSMLNTRLTGLRELGESLRAQLSAPGTNLAPVTNFAPVAELAPPQIPPATPRYAPRPAIFDRDTIDQFARGSIQACFGPEYAIYEHRRAPRIPNTDLMLVSRIVEMDATRLVTKTGSYMVAEYDVPVDMWFYQDNVYPFTPYSMLMEMALQPCGFLSAFMGPTLAFPEIDFYFRNLDGQGKLLREVDLRGRTLVNRVTLTSSTVLQGIIIQKYTFDMMLDGESFYTGSSTFGYFTLPSLSTQNGLDMGKSPAKWHERAPDAAPVQIAGNRQSGDPYSGDPHSSGFMALPTGRLAFLDGALIDIHGGAHGLGYIYATTLVDPSDWFLACHFYQDPVMPGSLGLEAIVQAIQAYAIQASLGISLISPRFGSANGDMTWKYRGQVLGDSGAVYLEIHITGIERTDEQVVVTADASLWRGALRIYEFKRVAVRVQEAG